MPNIFLIAVIAIVVITFLFILGAGFVSASPGEIKVISGPRGQRVLHGKTGWKIPILERVDSMTAGMISVDVKTSDFVPTNDYINVKVDAAVKVKIGTEKPELFRAATRNFLYKTSDEIADEIRDTLEGHLRAIIGQMQLSTVLSKTSVLITRSKYVRKLLKQKRKLNKKLNNNKQNQTKLQMMLVLKLIWKLHKNKMI